MLRKLALASVAVCVAATALAAESMIWVEAEQAVKTHLSPNGPLDNVNPAELSGGAWISGWSHENVPDSTAEYSVEVPAAGAYRLWVRAGMGSGLSYAVDGAAAATDIDVKKGVNPIPSAADGNPHYPPALKWYDAGTLDLASGKHTFVWHLGGTKVKDRWAGMDCFVLTTGEFTPNGKYKPGEKAPEPRPVFAPGQAWDFNPPDDTFDPASLVDLRYLNEQTAGEHGFIRANKDGSGFVRGDGAPIRFWAVLAGPQAKMDLETQKRAATFLAKRGVNIVRLFSGICVQKEGAKITDVDDKYLDDMFKMIAALKAAGIYTMTSPYWATSVKAPKSWGIPGAVGAHTTDALLFFDPLMQEGYKAWMKAMYTRKNPYTGMTLAEDPAVAILQIQNEDSLLWWGFSNLKGEHLTRLQHQFAEFLKQKYGSYEKAQAAWHHYKADAMPDDWEHDLPGFMHIWDLTRDGRAKKGKIPGFEERAAAQTEFLARTMYAFNQDMAKYLREELGCKQLINAGNWKSSDPLLSQDAEYWSYTANDVVARNIYTGGLHSGVQTGWKLTAGDVYTDVSMTRMPVKLPTNLKQPVGRPFMITETLWTRPDLYQSEGPLMIAAQESLSGMNGAFWSTQGMDFWDRSMSYKWSWNTPMLLGQFPAAALVYRTGLVEEGKPAIVEHRSLQDLWERKTPIISEESGWDPNRDAENITMSSSVKTTADPLAYLVGPVRVAYDSDPAKTEVIDLGKYIDREKQIVRSDTGQIECDWGRGVYRVNAPAVQAAAGFLKDAGPQQLADVRIDCQNAYASIVVVALDGKPLKQSAKVLVQVGTTSRPAGWTEVPTQVKVAGELTDAFRLLDVGKAPWQIENADATVTVANPALTKAVLLDANGMPTPAPVQFKQVDGKATVVLPPNTMYLALTNAAP